MVYSEFCREKLFQYKINGQSRPFVDQNLQLQIPGIDSHAEVGKSQSHSPIYAYYSQKLPKIPHLPILSKEAELDRVMTDAEQSYLAWKKMRKQLLKAAHRYFSKHTSSNQ